MYNRALTPQEYLEFRQKNNAATRRWRLRNQGKLAAYRTANKLVIAAQRRIYRKLNTTYKEIDWRSHLRRKYGITAEQYNELLLKQGGVCAICHQPNRAGEKLHVDHNRESGKVRGLLCNRCNRMVVPVVEHSPELISKTFVYLKENI